MDNFKKDPVLDMLMDHYRHWCELSEAYTGVDSFLTVMARGWRVVQNKIYLQTISLGSTRTTIVASCFLQRGDQFRTIRIVWNPTLTRVITNYRLQAVYLTSGKATHESVSV
ncbi:hypothetical protein MASR2M15_01720 [Anaerolineales bacterium]